MRAAAAGRAAFMASDISRSIMIVSFDPDSSPHSSGNSDRAKLARLALVALKPSV
jgi:hypothetical protein